MNGNTAIASTPAFSPESLPPLVYKDQPVITSKVLAALYETGQSNIRENFRRQRTRFSEGKHFFKVEGSELKAFKECVRNPDASAHDLPKTGGALTLWTARGAARHAKMLDTDKAWEVFELLEDSYFGQKSTTSPFILPDQHLFLTRLLQAKVNAFPEPQRAKLYAQAWMRTKNKFRIAKIEQLPTSQFENAVEYLTMQQLKLPNTVRQDAPALPTADAQDLEVKKLCEEVYASCRPLRDEMEKAMWSAQAGIATIYHAARKILEKGDGSNVRNENSLAHMAAQHLDGSAELAKNMVEGVYNNALLVYADMMTSLELRTTRAALYRVRRALTA